MEAAVTFVVAVLNSRSFFGLLRPVLLFGGVILLAVGALVGAGFREPSYHNPPYFLSLSYARTTVRERPTRRNQHLA